MEGIRPSRHGCLLLQKYHGLGLYRGLQLELSILGKAGLNLRGHMTSEKRRKILVNEDELLGVNAASIGRSV